MFGSFQALPVCQLTRKGETGEVLRMFISIAPLPVIAFFCLCECSGCCSTKAWEELLGQPRCPCASPVFSCQSGRHNLEFRLAFLYHKYL